MKNIDLERNSQRNKANASRKNTYLDIQTTLPTNFRAKTTKQFLQSHN